jgi:16S rRNA (cytosine967-C5)-methyltransferase
VQNVQRIAAQTVTAVLAGRSLNPVLDDAWRRNRQLSAGERGAVQDISYGTLRHLGRLSSVLSQLASKPVANPELRALLLAALYQLEYTSAAPYAIVNHAVDCAGQIGGHPGKSFSNAVLRNFQRRRAALLAVADAEDGSRFSYPGWWINRLREQFPSEVKRLLETGNRHPPMTLRANRRRTTPSDYLRLLEESGQRGRLLAHGAIVLEKPVPIEGLPGFREGMVSVQDAGAQLAAPLLDARDGMRVLDACAAPGGKTAHLAELADLDLTALDNDHLRLERVRSNLSRLGLQARLCCADAAALDTWWDGTSFDRILLDAPCSASGVVRRHPDIKWLRRSQDVHSFAAQQRMLLDSLWKAVAHGGKLLYVTCSIFGEEDQEQVHGFVARHPDARILEGMPGRQGLLLPDDEHDGFYFALLQKA